MKNFIMNHYVAVSMITGLIIGFIILLNTSVIWREDNMWKETYELFGMQTYVECDRDHYYGRNNFVEVSLGDENYYRFL